jgi:anti-sigma B factor antagonist
VHLNGEIDMANARELMVTLREASAGGPVTVDMSEVTFIDSSGLLALLASALSSDGNGPMVLVDPSPQVSRVMKIIGMDRIPQIEIRRT